jgi:hypothetical protein
MRNLACLLALLALCACETRNTEKLARKASKELGIPVVLNTTNEDFCANRKLNELVTQYGAMNDSEREIIRRGLSTRYKTIEIQASKPVGRVEGAQYYMVFGYRGTCDGPFADKTFCKRREEPMRKLVGDTRKVLIKNPEMIVVKGESLILQAEESGNAAHSYKYFTENRDLYESVNSLGALEAAIKRPSDMELVDEAVAPSLCAPGVALRDLL